ncbi:MAG: FHA domain-containing protein [Candidatus Eremiobacteraeota bacterium]|nr:FHA domain-containing protein [Candidatus Eremiobacteraeota bacterium]
MESSFGILRFLFLILLSLFLFEIMRILNRNMKESHRKNGTKKRRNAFLKLIAGEEYIGAKKGHVFRIKKQCSIGRDNENNIVIEDPFSSNFHSIIVEKNRKYYLSDMDSKNGTVHNGIQTSGKILLEEGDMIEVGHMKFKFEVE